MSVKDRPHYTIAADVLAQWIDDQRDRWWFVDGDPLLTSVIDFPCPSDELAPAIRKIGRPILLQDTNAVSSAKGEEIGSGNLDALSDTNNRRRQKTWLLSWQGSDIDWLLIEDQALVSR
ncbi:MAG TPA: hypothetical protein VMV10_19450 [Pirellulales bacterium]|nr:hypothetical protein [Pirellulales bacterium]